MWSLLCLIANKSSDLIFKPLNGDCVRILRPWISLPVPFSEEHRQKNLTNVSLFAPRQGCLCVIISLNLVFFKIQRVKIPRPELLQFWEAQREALLNADSDSVGLGGMGPETLRF